MNKWILPASIALNAVFMVYIYKVNKKPKYEQVILETHLSNPKSETANDMVSTKLAAVRKEGNVGMTEDQASPEPITDASDEEMTQSNEKMEGIRNDFLSHELDLTNEQVFEYQRLRNEYFTKSSELWKDNPYGEMSFDNHELLSMEEQLHHNLESLFGKKNWERYKKFREAYNKQGFERQIEENQPFLFMGL